MAYCWLYEKFSDEPGSFSCAGALVIVMVIVIVRDVVPSLTVSWWVVTPGVRPATLGCTSSPAGMPGASIIPGAPLLNEAFSAESPPVLACNWALKVFTSPSETACVGGSMPCGEVNDRLLAL